MSRLLPLVLLAACGGNEPLEPLTTPTTTPTPTTATEPAPALRELAFFQAVEVPVLAGEEAVESADRSAPLIAERDAILRAMVTVPADWVGSDLELAVDLTAGVGTETFTATVRIDQSSSDADPESGLVVDIPARAMATDATYVVRLSEGGVERDRFPETGEAALDPMVTGPLKITLVPFEANGFVPDTSAAVVEGYRAALMATYPVTDVQISVVAPEVWTETMNLGAINVRLGEIQEDAMYAGEVDWDVYYYGMVTGVASRDDFDGITGTSENGGNEELRRAYFAAGAAFGDQKSEDTLIHEIGHTHRLFHTPCDGEDDVDPDYPYVGGVTGVEGYDVRTGTFVSASESFDMMSYCFPRWISDFNFAKLADHVANAQSYE